MIPASVGGVHRCVAVLTSSSLLDRCRLRGVHANKGRPLRSVVILKVFSRLPRVIPASVGGVHRCVAVLTSSSLLDRCGLRGVHANNGRPLRSVVILKVFSRLPRMIPASVGGVHRCVAVLTSSSLLHRCRLRGVHANKGSALRCIVHLKVFSRLPRMIPASVGGVHRCVAVLTSSSLLDRCGLRGVHANKGRPLRSVVILKVSVAYRG